MKKKIIAVLILAIACLFSVVALSACGGDPAPAQQGQSEIIPPSGGDGDGGEGAGAEEGEVISGVNFSNAAFDYDGTEKALTVDGELPDGVSAVYTANTGTNAGTYNATVTLSGEGYKTLVLRATLTINKINYDMSGAEWNYEQAFDYNGSAKTVTVTGLPSGVSVKNYTDNSKTDAGTYNATVSFNYDTANYNAPSIPALSWTINKIDFPAVSFENSTVEYDDKQHSIQIVGNTPAGTTVSYTYDGETATGKTEVGTYAVVVTLTNKNYNTKTYSATLKITSTEKQLYMVRKGTSVFFQNNLDGDSLYTYNGNLTKINNDAAKYLTCVGNDIYYCSLSLTGNAVKKYTSDGAKKITTVLGTLDSLAADGTYVYYSVTSIPDKTGIFRVKADGSEEPVRVTANRAKDLTVLGGYIYFANYSEGKKLYRVSASATNATGTALNDEAIASLVTDGTNLFYNAGTIGKAIKKYIPSSNTTVKLTTDSGSYLTVLGDYVYYVNNDLLTSTLFGDGICKVSKNKTSDSSVPGTKLYSITDNGVSSLTTDGTYLYYYKLNDKHLYRNNASFSSETDLMASFTPPEKETYPSAFVRLAERNGEIYYTNPLDYGYLYKVNLTTKATQKIVDDSCSGVWFNGDYMYYSTYVLTNYALWKMNLSTNEPVKISSDRCDNLIFDNDAQKIYFVKVGSLYNNHICSMDFDGGNVTELDDTDNLWVADLMKIGDTLYYTRNPKIKGKRLCSYSITTDTASIVNDDLTGLTFTIYGQKIFLYSTDNTLKVLSLAGVVESTIATNVTINDLIVINGILYYSSDTTQNKGLFAYNIASGTTTKISSTCASGLMNYNGNLYFINAFDSYVTDYSNLKDGNGKLYCYNGSEISEIA